MSFRKTAFTTLVEFQPDRARAKILAAFRAAKMNLVDAATRLGVSYRTLSRWTERLEMADELAEMRERARTEGWHHQKLGGRPKGS